MMAPNRGFGPPPPGWPRVPFFIRCRGCWAKGEVCTAEVVDDEGTVLWVVEWGPQPDPTGTPRAPVYDETLLRSNYGEGPVAYCPRCKPA